MGEATRTLSDASGDAAFSFIDLTYVKRTSTLDTFTVEVGFVGPIDALTYDAVNSVPGVEYSYGINFDLDGDNSLLNNLTISLTSEKRPGDIQRVGSLLDFATLNIGITRPAPPPDILQTDAVKDVSVKMVGNNTLVFTFNKKNDPSLADLGVDTPLAAQAEFVDAGKMYLDSLPDDLKYAN